MSDNSFKQKVREHLAERSLAALRAQLWSVRPIFWPDDRGDAELVGSCVLFSAGNRHFLVSAAHVFDRSLEGTLYIATHDELRELRGYRKYTSPPHGDTRDDDKIDFGFLELEDSLVAALSSCRFLTMNDLGIDDVATPGPNGSTHYLAIGYPATKAKRERSVAKITPQPIACSGRSPDDQAYHLLGVREYSHIVMEFNRKRSVNRFGPVTAPAPHGMSGGGLWRFDTQLGNANTPDKLVGILIEYHQKGVKALVATRIGLCMEALRSFYPELQSLIPSASRVRVKAVLT